MQYVQLNLEIPNLNTFNAFQGKTTTTERMLYYSGFTRRLGGTFGKMNSFLRYSGILDITIILKLSCLLQKSCL